jgi:CHAD domain-containing protein
MDGMMQSIASIGPIPMEILPRLHRRLEAGLAELRGLLSDLGPQSQAKTIHDIRVATRRARVLCDLLQLEGGSPHCQALERSLKKLSRALSAVRSWDVSAQQLKIAARQWRGAGQKGLGFIRHIIKKKSRRLRRGLAEIDVAKFSHALEFRSSAPQGDPVVDSITLHGIRDQMEKNLERVSENWRRYRQSRSSSDLHGLRISLKKLRYNLEIQSACLGRADEERVGRLKSLQDGLGYIHDLHVLRDHLKQGAIRKKIPSGKIKRYHRLQKHLKQTETRALKAFEKGEGARLPALLEGVIS